MKISESRENNTPLDRRIRFQYIWRGKGLMGNINGRKNNLGKKE
jgi:hypothetical protein